MSKDNLDFGKNYTRGKKIKEDMLKRDVPTYKKGSGMTGAFNVDGVNVKQNRKANSSTKRQLDIEKKRKKMHPEMSKKK